MSAPAYRLRPYAVADEDAAIELWRRSWQATMPHIDFAARVDWWRKRWRGELVPQATIMVAEADGAIAGYVTVDPNSGYLDQIEAQCRELGVGRVATLCGRYWGMDRDHRWERVRRAYDALTGREEAPSFATADAAIAAGGFDDARGAAAVAGRRVVVVALLGAALDAVAGRIEPGWTEKQVAWEIEQYVRTHGGDGMSFQTIVAGGPWGALPHARARDAVLVEGQGIVIDMGVLLDGYCSDMTRTIFLGQPDAKFTSIYDIVLTAQAKGSNFTKTK